MTAEEKKIPFKIEFSRILDLFANQIYQSPLALLRENTQNAFDAVLMKLHAKAGSSQENFHPRIDVRISQNQIIVTDNGVGMTSQEIEDNYWYAGKSGKNTSVAREAGVVGTFGIGAMANFGVADQLEVESESMSGQRTVSSVRKDELSTEFNSISLKPLTPTNSSGTTVRATLSQSVAISISEARSYLKEFVRFVDVPVYFNDERLSGSRLLSLIPSSKHSWRDCVKGKSIAGIVEADVYVAGMATGELRVVVQNLKWDFQTNRPGKIVLLQTRAGIQTLRSGFGLSSVALQSPFEWGGAADIPILRPTAGREALDASSNQLLHQLIREIDDIVSDIASQYDVSYLNDAFLRWIVSRRRFSLCGSLEVEPYPNRKPMKLESLSSRPNLRYYAGRDTNVIRTHASEEQPLVVLSRRSPRRECELGYLKLNEISPIDTSPKVLNELFTEDQSIAQIAVSIRIGRTLEEDYFLSSELRYGVITDNLPILVQQDGPPPTIFLNPNSDSVSPLFALYEGDYKAFGPFVKDFVRTTVFPRISHLVPSSTSAGAEAFLRHLRTHQEAFTYSRDDKGDLDEIFEDLRAGRLSTVEAAHRLISMDRSQLEVTHSTSAPLSTVVQDDPSNANSFDPKPGIDRRDVETSARILTSEVSDVDGYQCFLSLTDRVHREKGEFFLQPHTTEIIWGGQKVIFVFQHHSGRFGLYYDILCPKVIGSSGGGKYVPTTVIAKNRIFIPVPTEIDTVFLPSVDEVIRLDVRCDILYLDDSVSSSSALEP